VATRFTAAIAILASLAGSGVAESRDPDIEGILAPRVLAPAPPGLPTAHLVWIDPAGVAIGVEGSARDEARDLLRKMGVAVSWRRGEAGEVARPAEVRVILLDRGAARDKATHVLGATPSRFEATPFLWVHVPNVRAVMGLRPHGPTAALDPPSARAFAIALGRVVAHELVHALAPSVPHGTGLMSEALTRRQLTAATLPVEPGVGLAVCAALRGEPKLPPADTGILAVATAAREGER
jgi:hypothetical protein